MPPKTPSVEFLFDFGSPNAFLARRVIPEIERRTGARFEVVPVLLGGGVRLLDGVAPAAADLELLRVVDAPGVTHLTYQVSR